MGSARAPETAGPRIRPRLKAQMMRDMPRAWDRLVEDSDMIAFTVPTTPVCTCVFVMVKLYYHVKRAELHASTLQNEKHYSVNP